LHRDDFSEFLIFNCRPLNTSYWCLFSVSFLRRPCTHTYTHTHTGRRKGERDGGRKGLTWTSENLCYLPPVLGALHRDDFSQFLVFHTRPFNTSYWCLFSVSLTQEGGRERGLGAFLTWTSENLGYLPPALGALHRDDFSQFLIFHCRPLNTSYWCLSRFLGGLVILGNRDRFRQGFQERRRGGREGGKEGGGGGGGGAIGRVVVVGGGLGGGGGGGVEGGGGVGGRGGGGGRWWLVQAEEGGVVVEVLMLPCG